MMNRRLKRGLILLVMVCAAIFAGIAIADEEEAAEMEAYWDIVGAAHQNESLARTMDGDYAKLPVDMALRRLGIDIDD